MLKLTKERAIEQIAKCNITEIEAGNKGFEDRHDDATWRHMETVCGHQFFTGVLEGKRQLILATKYWKILILGDYTREFIYGVETHEGERAELDSCGCNDPLSCDHTPCYTYRTVD